MSGGGEAGITNSLGAALWVLDTLFIGAECGLAGMDITEGSGNGPYAPIDLDAGTVRSPYYALLLFHLATQGEDGSLIRVVLA